MEICEKCQRKLVSIGSVVWYDDSTFKKSSKKSMGRKELNLLQELEFSVLNGIQAYGRCDFLDVVMPAISWICNHGEVWILLALCLLAYRKTRRTGLAVCLALALELVCCNLILKPLVGRVRPYVVNPAVTLLVAPLADASFPSGHAAASFAAAFALRASGSRLWKGALVLAILIAVSRLYLYVHWPSDVLVGALLGALLGHLAGKLVQNHLHRLT